MLHCGILREKSTHQTGVVYFTPCRKYICMACVQYDIDKRRTFFFKFFLPSQYVLGHHVFVVFPFDLTWTENVANNFQTSKC